MPLTPNEAMLRIESLLGATRGIMLEENEQAVIQQDIADTIPAFQWTETDPAKPGIYLNSTSSTPDASGSQVNMYRVEIRPSTGSLELHIRDSWYQFNNAYEYWLGPLNLLPHGQLIPSASFT